MVSVPLRGVGCFKVDHGQDYTSLAFPSPCGVWVVSKSPTSQCCWTTGFRPLAGCGLFPMTKKELIKFVAFPSPCGVWVVSNDKEGTNQVCSISVPLRGVGCFPSRFHKLPYRQRFRPLAGCGLFRHCGSTTTIWMSFRPLAGCGLFRQSCTFFLVQQEKELSTLLFYCIILADGLSIAN